MTNKEDNNRRFPYFAIEFLLLISSIKQYQPPNIIVNDITIHQHFSCIGSHNSAYFYCMDSLSSGRTSLMG